MCLSLGSTDVLCRLSQCMPLCLPLPAHMQPCLGQLKGQGQSYPQMYILDHSAGLESGSGSECGERAQQFLRKKLLQGHREIKV